MKTKIYDLTPKISSRLGVFPGDQTFERSIALSFAGGNHLELSSLRSTLHLGAHADAPSHYAAGGVSIEKRELGIYMGLTEVVRVTGLSPRERVRIEHFKRAPAAPRVLIDTGSFVDPEKWNSDFCSLAPELLDWLADHRVRLVGIDTPSVDPEDSKKMEAHQILAKRDFAVLEGLLLKDVPEGLYTLIALPLPIEDGDASPVRAVLLPVVDGFPEFKS